MHFLNLNKNSCVHGVSRRCITRFEKADKQNGIKILISKILFLNFEIKTLIRKIFVSKF